MQAALVLGAFALGLAGAPHCVAMCAAPCAAVAGSSGRGQITFHGARIAGYAAAGACAAASVNVLAGLGQLSPALAPLWSLLHAAALALGIWLAVTARQPTWLQTLGRRAPVAAPAWQAVSGPWRTEASPWRPLTAGALWVAWPCGLLQSALVTAALADQALGGAAVMAAFGMGTAIGLQGAAALWRRSQAGGNDRRRQEAWAVRLGGALLAAASAWALTRPMWPKVAAYCGW